MNDKKTLLSCRKTPKDLGPLCQKLGTKAIHRLIIPQREEIPDIIKAVYENPQQTSNSVVKNWKLFLQEQE